MKYLYAFKTRNGLICNLIVWVGKRSKRVMLWAEQITTA